MCITSKLLVLNSKLFASGTCLFISWKRMHTYYVHVHMQCIWLFMYTTNIHNVNNSYFSVSIFFTLRSNLKTEQNGATFFQRAVAFWRLHTGCSPVRATLVITPTGWTVRGTSWCHRGPWSDWRSTCSDFSDTIAASAITSMCTTTTWWRHRHASAGPFTWSSVSVTVSSLYVLLL